MAPIVEGSNPILLHMCARLSQCKRETSRLTRLVASMIVNSKGLCRAIKVAPYKGNRYAHRMNLVWHGVADGPVIILLP